MILEIFICKINILNNVSNLAMFSDFPTHFFKSLGTDIATSWTTLI